MIIQTDVLCEPVDVVQRLRACGLDRDKLIEVARRAVYASRDCTPNHPANAPGTFSYQYGTQALRDLFVGKDWAVDRTDSIESIWNEERRIRVAYQNVDMACDLNRLPKPKSIKGEGSERVCKGNQLALFADLPLFARLPKAGDVTLYLMVSQDGLDVRVELSRPVIENKKFATFIERIFLLREGEWEDGLLKSKSEGAAADDFAADDFNVVVSRK
jgi:hypothetical protein